MTTPKRDRKPAATGLPPWDTAPTPPLQVFRTALEVEPDLLDRMKAGHLANLLPMALDALQAAEQEAGRYATAAESLAERVAELEAVAEAAERRRSTKREYQRDYREGLRGNRAARAAQRQGVQP